MTNQHEQSNNSPALPSYVETLTAPDDTPPLFPPNFQYYRMPLDQQPDQTERDYWASRYRPGDASFTLLLRTSNGNLIWSSEVGVHRGLGWPEGEGDENQVARLVRGEISVDEHDPTQTKKEIILQCPTELESQMHEVAERIAAGDPGDINAKLVMSTFNPDDVSIKPNLVYNGTTLGYMQSRQQS